MNTCSYEPMLTNWFQKKPAPVRAEYKRNSVRLYPPLTADEENKIIPMPLPSEREYALAGNSRYWRQDWDQPAAG